MTDPSFAISFVRINSTSDIKWQRVHLMLATSEPGTKFDLTVYHTDSLPCVSRSFNDFQLKRYVAKNFLVKKKKIAKGDLLKCF